MVSIITPTYNCARYIAETISSVISQTYAKWEMLIQDDCSTDNTREIVAGFAAKDPRIKYECNQSNSGAAVTRNNALRRATGKWIAFLDSDDLWLPEKLERQISFMLRYNYSFSYTNYIEIDENSKDIGIRVSGPKHISKCWMNNYCWPGCLTIMYDCSIVGYIQIMDIKKNNDYAMWLKVIKKTDCYLLDETLAKYRKRIGSISNHGYTSLISWHYRLFRKSEKQNCILALFNTFRNLIFGFLKKLIYVSRYSV